MAPWGLLHAASTPFNPRNRKILAAAALAGLDISVAPNFKFGVTNKEPAFLYKFPLGNVPAFERQGGFNLSESNAIAFYIAECASDPAVAEQLLGSTPEQRALIQQWIFFTSLHLDPTIGKLCAWRAGLAECDESVERNSAGDMKRWMCYLETSVKGRTWIATSNDGMGPSLADLAIGSVMHFAFAVYVDEGMRAEYTAVVSWYERMVAIKELKGLFEGEMIRKRIELPERN